MSADDPQRRRSLLVAALGFTRVRCADPAPALVALRRWLDSWTGAGALITGMLRQGYDVDLSSVGPGRWQATFLEANPQGGAPVAAGYGEQTRPWLAVQEAAWHALNRPPA